VLRAEQHDDVSRLELARTPNRVVGLTVSVFLVRGVLVDSGFPSIGRELLSWLLRDRPRGALITHAHEDHAGNVEGLAASGIPIGMSAATRESVSASRSLLPYRRMAWGTPAPLRSRFDPFEDAELRLVPMPGHSDDHHVVWDTRTATLFAGDLFLGVRSSLAHAHERPRLLIDSLRRAISLGPKRMFDAHRGLIRDPAGALEAKARWLEELIANVESLDARGWSVPAIQRALLGREGRSGLVSFGEYSKRNLVRAILSERGP
jgi:glyoxylase-like metal-dependent hydrolase (beta-lactamase superfamily II)